MLDFILTYRNRDIKIVSKCLNSLQNQTSKDFKVTLVNYGSVKSYSDKLIKLLKAFKFVTLIHCDTQDQLWNKSRAINIAFKQTESSKIFIGDVDMMYAPNFIDTISKCAKPKTATYFQVGFLSEEESALNKKFRDYHINFKSTQGATGMTLFNREELTAINGYDEFYNGWGSEDTDVHIRLKNAGYSVNYFDEDILILHQWHAKTYRSDLSTAPFHTYLEKINQDYLAFTSKANKIKANTRFMYGVYNQSDYDDLITIDSSYVITNTISEVKAFINFVLLEHENKVVELVVKQHPDYKSLKQFIKKIQGKKTFRFLDLESVNNLLLETLIYYLRNAPYSMNFNQEKNIISLTIKL